MRLPFWTIVLLEAVAAADVRAQPAADPIATVVVYAQRRAAPLADVPMSVAVMQDDDLAEAGLGDLDDLGAHLPVFDVQRSVGAATTTLRIRRIGALGNVPTLEPAVALFVDGAYRARSFLTGDLLDIGRVEVVAGPQSALYGKNASAGVVSLYTLAPPEDFEAWAEIVGGIYDAGGSPGIFNTRGGVGGSLSPSWRASLAVAHSQHGHTFANALPGMPDGDDESRWTWRGQLLRDSDWLRVRLLVGYVRERDDQGESDVYLAPGSRTAMTAAALAQSGRSQSCPDNVPNNRTTCSVATNQLDLESIDATLVAEASLPNGWILTSTTAWERYDILRVEDDVVQLSAPILYFHDLQSGEGLQQELRLLSPRGAPLGWLAGLFYYDNEFERGSRSAIPTFGPNGALAFDPVWPVPFALPDQRGLHYSRIDAEYSSAFAEATWRLSPRVELIAGLRWSEETKRALIANSVTRPGASVVSVVLTPAVSPSGADVNGALERASSALTWSITPKVRINEEVMAYASLARSAKPGGFNNGTGNAPLAAREFDDEDIRHYEVGLRASAARRTLRFSAAAFHTEYRDYQDAVFLLAQFAVGNVERVELTGLELSAQAAIGGRTQLDASVSYVDAEYAQHTAGVCAPGRTPDGRLPQSCDLSGERPLNAPPWEVHVGLQHTIPANWGELFARLDWSWTDRYPTTFSLDPRLVQDAWHDVNVRIGTRIGSAYELALWCENALDENVVQIASTLNFFSDASWQTFPGEPRSYGVTLRVRF